MIPERTFLSSTAPNARSGWHIIALLGTVFLLQLLFLQVPRFGDDFTYWSFAFELHERGLKVWSQESFHSLRWPVWGMCWLLQAILGPGFPSFWGTPIIYVGAGAAIAFTFGQMLSGSLRVAWAAGLAFALHPLLDTVCYRPMPDVSEAVLGAGVVLAWWQLMHARCRRGLIGWSVVTGMGVFLCESNRLTGVFIVPVLILCTLLYFRQRFGWLVLAGVISALFYAGEMLFYYQLFGDPLHNLHANMGGKGVKGTEPLPIWYLPFRFVNTLWQDNVVAPIFCLLAAFGGWLAWKRHGVLGRVIVLWFVVLYFEYSCAPQSIWPWRPIVRDADRFLAGLAMPMSLLVALGFWKVLALPGLRRYRAGRWLHGHPIGAAAIMLAIIIAGTSRQFTSLEFVPAMRAYLNGLAPGTKVFTHEELRPMIYLVAPEAASRIQWLYKDEIIPATAVLEDLATKADEFWYARKLVWLRTRKGLERKKIEDPAPLPSYFTNTSKNWKLNAIFTREDATDLVFYRRRIPSDPAPLVLEASAPELQQVVPALPVEWRKDSGPARPEMTWQIPEKLRGKLARVEVLAASADVEAVTPELRFGRKGREIALYRLKSYLHPKANWDYFAVPIPADADQLDVRLVFSKNAKRVTFEDLRIVID
jgi:hypothetical protein